jgi:anti-sigma-K factor RskA
LGVAHNELLDQHETEKAMLVHDKVQETHEDTTEVTAAVESSIPAQALAADGPGGTRSARRRWRWVSALAATGAVVGIVTIAAVTQSDQDASDTVPVSDGSYEVAELNRMERLQDLAIAP